MLFYSPRKTHNWTRRANYQKMERGVTLRKKILEKISQCRKKLKGYPSGFFNIHSVAKHQKIEGGPLLKKIPKKGLRCILYLLVQKVRFGTLTFRKTL